MRLSFPILAAVAALALLLALCAGCESEPTPTPQPPTAEPSPTPTAEPPTEEALVVLELAPDVVESVATANYSPPVVPGQLILSGLDGDIAAVLEQETIAALRLEEIARVTYAGPEEEEPLHFVLFTIESDQTVQEAIAAVYEVVFSDDAEPIPVFADANYFVANPWVIEGAPWVIEGATSMTPTQTAVGHPAELKKQWALSSQAGIGLYDQLGVRQVIETGAGVDVFVFDTSAYPPAPTGIATVPLFDGVLAAYAPPLAVTVPVSSGNMAAHGYFVAALVDQVAPGSAIHLVRALNDDGVGDVFSLIVLMDAVMQAQPPGRPAVFNLSLSLTPVAEFSLLTATRFAQLMALLPPPYRPLLANDNPVGAMALIVAAAHQRGITIAAAAGNGFSSPAGIPATFAETIGVAGSSFAGNRSCFSNDPQPGAALFAPSGDAAAPAISCSSPLSPTLTATSCPPSAANAADCQFTLTSLTTPTTFGLAAGTSFGTPLASGVAALVLEQAAGQPACGPAAVKQVLLNSARTVLTGAVMVLSAPNALAALSCP